MSATDQFMEKARDLARVERTWGDQVNLIAHALSTAHREGFEEGMKQEGWQDIATAPKDGTRILIYYGAHGNTVKQAWSANERGHFVRLAKWDGGQWRLDMAGHFRMDATHWMPLPTPPSEAERTA